MVLPGQPQRLRLLDEKGNDVRNATWTVSNPDLAEIRREDGTWITGLKPGKVTVIATCNGQSAEAKVTVLGGVASSQAGLASEPQADRIGAGQSSSSEDSSPIYLTPERPRHAGRTSEPDTSNRREWQAREGGGLERRRPGLGKDHTRR